MAFIKTARAAICHPNWSPENWGNFVGENRGRITTGPYRTASSSPNLIAQASEILEEQFDPRNYLLTHATIVASVDTVDVPNVKLGTVNEYGRKIARRWPNYCITPGTEQWINNNNDSWDRPVLLKSYPTFVGAHNFCEHVQLEAQSKGRIIDAVARDIGPSIYVDILTATNRKHASLISDIERGRLNTLSMGCSVTETQCTKCGNVAADEAQMCPCIKYEKGNIFFDNRGGRHKTAELCGHYTLDPTGGVTFIEASWVAVPAFPGAVMRNILAPDVINVRTQDQVRQVLASPPRDWTDDGMAKAARVGHQHFGQAPDPMAPPPGGAAPPGGDPMAPPGDPMAPPGAPPEKDPMEELEEEIEKYVLDKIKKKLKKKMKEDVSEEAASSPAELETSSNENINRQANFVHGVNAIVRIARSDVELLDGLARLNESHGIKISRDMYRTALRVGSTDGHKSLEEYLGQCAEVLTRKPTVGEAKTLVRLGRILSLRKKARF